MRVLITGGAGFIGSNYVHECQAKTRRAADSSRFEKRRPLASAKYRLFKAFMRLATKAQSAIKHAIAQADANAAVYLFGSRTDDAAWGGDIDLLVLSKKIKFMDKLDILVQLHQQLGDRKIDIAIYPDATRPFPRVVMEKAVRL